MTLDTAKRVGDVYVLTLPARLTEEQAHHIHEMWRERMSDRPLVILEDGARLERLGLRLTMTAHLFEGPLGDALVQVEIDQESMEVPESIGGYVRQRTESGRPCIDTRGNPAYVWQPVEVGEGEAAA